MNFSTRDRPTKLYRVARDPDVAAFVDWRWLHGASRFDDPRIARERERVEDSMPGASLEEPGSAFSKEMTSKIGNERAYRTVYTASEPVGAIMEIVQGWRKDLKAIAEMREILDDDRTVPSSPTKIEPPPYYLGEIFVDHAKALVDVENSVQQFRAMLLEEAVAFGFGDITRGELLGGVTGFTRLVSAAVFQDSATYAGLYYGRFSAKDTRTWRFSRARTARCAHRFIRRPLVDSSTAIRISRALWSFSGYRSTWRRIHHSGLPFDEFRTKLKASSPDPGGTFVSRRSAFAS